MIEPRDLRLLDWGDQHVSQPIEIPRNKVFVLESEHPKRDFVASSACAWEMQSGAPLCMMGL